MTEAIMKSCEESMQKRISAFDKDLTKLRTGRASVAIFDGIRVDYYGTLTALNQVATLATPDARTVTIAPFEKSLIGEIEKAIMKADLGLQPNSDGNLVRVPIPALSEERRKDIVKSIKKMGEDSKVAIRQARRDANDAVKKLEKSKDVAEDESKKLQASVQKITDTHIKLIDERVTKKEAEILKV